MKKLFGGINLSWPKVILMAVLAGAYTAFMAMWFLVRNTSFIDISVSFEVWIFFGIFIIMNSKSPIDSAAKCFIFFLISQPPIYLLQDVINGSNLFLTYYRNWVLWTVACVPMGFIGYYMKKDKWWGLIILTPILLFLGEHYGTYFSLTNYYFPYHLLTTIFCFATLIIYPLYIFNNKKVRIAGVIISLLIIAGMSTYCLLKPKIYSTDIFLSGEKHQFDDTYKAYFDDSKYGDLSIEYEKDLDCYLLHADFKKGGKTKFTLESASGEKQVYEITIKTDTFKYKKIKN